MTAHRCLVCGGDCSLYICAQNVEASEPTCPTCKGKCCRSDIGYRVVHMGAESYSHECEACYDGNVPALGDRDSIVAFLRREYRSGPWEGTQVFLILADAIERKVDREVDNG